MIIFMIGRPIISFLNLDMYHRHNLRKSAETEKEPRNLARFAIRHSFKIDWTSVDSYVRESFKLFLWNHKQMQIDNLNFWNFRSGSIFMSFVFTIQIANWNIKAGVWLDTKWSCSIWEIGFSQFECKKVCDLNSKDKAHKDASRTKISKV